jgi:hypothetical protein
MIFIEVNKLSERSHAKAVEREINVEVESSLKRDHVLRQFLREEREEKCI